MASPPKLDRSKWSPLVSALYNDSLASVQSILKADPLAAITPLSCNEEPLVLAAVRSGCSPHILALLLQSGTAVDATDILQLTALSCVAQVEEVHMPPMPSMSDAIIAPRLNVKPKACLRMPGGAFRIFNAPEGCEERCCAYAYILLSYGANPRLHDPEGMEPADRAETGGHPRLANLIRHWGGEQVRLLRLLRSRTACPCQCSAQSRRSCLLCFSDGACERVCEMLAPRPPGLAVVRPFGMMGPWGGA